MFISDASKGSSAWNKNGLAFTRNPALVGAAFRRGSILKLSSHVKAAVDGQRIAESASPE